MNGKHAATLKLLLQVNVRVVLVGRTYFAEMFERFRKEVVEIRQLVDIFNDADTGESQFVDAVRKLRSEPAFIVAHLEANSRLAMDELADGRVCEEIPQLRFAVPFDDEIAVELIVADFDILHPERATKSRKQTLAIDFKLKSVRVDVRSPQAGVGRAVVTVAFGVGVECES